MVTAEFRIPAENVEKLKTKLEKLNKIAAKLGVEPITYKYLRTEYVEEKHRESGRPTGYMIEYQFFEVAGKAPVIAGWQFAATVQHSHAAPIVRKAGEIEIPERYYAADFTLCEHCGVRRYRVDTFIVKNIETNKFKIVGSNCLKDFLGHASPAKIAQWMEYVTNIESIGEDNDFYGPITRKHIDLWTFAAHVALELRKNKFVSRKMVKEFLVPEYTPTTADAAASNMFARPGDKHKTIPEQIDRDFAEKAIAWMKALNAPVHKEFLYNLGILASSDRIEIRDQGYIAAGVFMYQKSIQVAAQTEADLNEFYGNVGDKVHIAVKIAHTQAIDSMYGTSQMFVMKDHKTGQTFIWFGSGEGAKIMLDKFSTAPDRKKIIFVIKGTIKKHQERNGIKQTILTRVKNTEVSYE